MSIRGGDGPSEISLARRVEILEEAFSMLGALLGHGLFPGVEAFATDPEMDQFARMRLALLMHDISGRIKEEHEEQRNDPHRSRTS